MAKTKLRPKAVGTLVPTLKGEATVEKRVMCEWSKKTPSTYYEARLEDGTLIILHENIVHGVMDGTYTLERPKPKGPRKVSTKKERALKHVTNLKRQRMSRGEIIKVLSKKLRVSKATAQTYYYAVR